MNILNHPEVVTIPVAQTPLVTNTVFIPIARGIGTTPGVLVDHVQFGVFKASWDKYDYLLFIVQCPYGLGTIVARYVVHDGPEEPSRLLLLAVGTWSNQLHDEVWVYNEGFWQKDHGLWLEVQKGNWEDVILNKDFKMALQKDVYSFFTSEKVYKTLGIPWKRGLIMHGTPGKLILKAIMKTCEEKGFLPLYVKSLQSWKGEERSMDEIFTHARNLSPCLLILEDLDSLVNDRNRSFFLNQLDGLTGNDGLLVIGTTNHLEQLDPGLKDRPSRFDRKFNFDDPDLEGRTLYAKYWQNKLKDNKNISFTDKLVDDIAVSTEKFSFAYLKEAFVSSLVELAGFDGDDSEKPTFEQLVHNRIEALRKELEVSPSFNQAQRVNLPPTSSSKQETHPNSDRFQSVLDNLLASVSSSRGKFRVLLDSPTSTYQELATSRSYGDYISPLQESEWLQDMRTRVNRLKLWSDQ
ncbi:hypothetical protein C0993_000091 [Termitomyces sp. T159_Od127]|nr:hypothetical protein C0993_000091 [Termitomyces sp. T159_Od127]